MRKGFTLIELLAVIVILAIIALIATPIILGIINDAKEDSEKRSVENYAHAVELAVARNATKQGGVIEPGIYSIEDEGKTVKKGTTEIQIDYKGEAIKAGELEVFADGKIELRGINFDGSNKKYIYSENTGVEELNTTVFDDKITFLYESYDSGDPDIKSNVCIDPENFKNKSLYKVVITDSNGVEKTYETLSLYGNLFEEDGFILAQNYDFYYIYYNESKTCEWGSLNNELTLNGEYNIKIDYLNGNVSPHLFIVDNEGDIQIFSTELVQGDATVEIKDNFGNVLTYSNEVEMFDAQGWIYISSDDISSSGELNYYNLLKQGEVITVTVTQNGKSYTLGGSEFKTSSGDDFCLDENYYWGNNKLGYYSGC